MLVLVAVTGEKPPLLLPRAFSVQFFPCSGVVGIFDAHFSGV